MARRPLKLEVHNHRVVCPYCREEVVFPSLMERIIIARRNCPVCKREMLIVDGRATKVPGDGAKKPPKRVRSRTSRGKN